MIDTNKNNKVVDSRPSENLTEDLLLEQHNQEIRCRYYNIIYINNLQRDLIYH